MLCLVLVCLAKASWPNMFILVLLVEKTVFKKSRFIQIHLFKPKMLILERRGFPLGDLFKPAILIQSFSKHTALNEAFRVSDVALWLPLPSLLLWKQYECCLFFTVLHRVL